MMLIRFYLHSFFLLLLLLLLSSPLFAQNRALLIGISRYPNLPSSKQLPGAVNDLKLIKETFLSDLGFYPLQVKTLSDESATKAGILSAFNDWLIDGTKAGDRVLFYFSGHGGHIKDQAPFDEDGADNDGYDETLVPYDTAPVDGSFSKMIRDDELQALFDILEKKKVEVLVIIDSCFSGSITRSIAISESQKPLIKSISSPLTRMINTRGGFQHPLSEATLIKSTTLRTVWTASAPLQYSFINYSNTNSVFTELMVNAFKDKGKQISNSELFQYISKGSQEFCQKTPRCYSKQKYLTPTLEIAEKKQLTRFINKHSGFTDPPSLSTPMENTLAIFQQKNISVSLREGKSIKLGSNIRVDIENKSNYSGQLIVLDHRADNSLIQLFPNRFKRNNKIDKKAKAWIPKNRFDGYSIQASIRGDSEIIVIIIHDQVNLKKLFAQTKDLQIIPIEKPNNYLGELLQTLQTPWVDDVINRHINYSVGRFAYTVY